MKLTEKILIGISILAIILNMKNVVGGSILTIISLGSLSIVYFYFGFALLNQIRLREIFLKNNYANISILRIFGAIFTGIALGTGLIGGIFKLMHWPGASLMLLFSLSCLFLVIIISVFKIIRKKNHFYKLILIRSIVMLLFVGSLFMISSRDIVNYKYSEYPDYANAFNEYMENHSTNSYEKWQEEHLKMMISDRENR